MLQARVVNGHAERLLIDEIPEAPDYLPGQHGYDDQVDDIAEVALLAHTHREDDDADQPAEYAADYGYAALPNRYRVHEIVPALDGEEILGARQHIEQSAEDDRERDDPKKELHRVLDLQVDALALETDYRERRDHADDDDDAVPRDLNAAYRESYLVYRRKHIASQMRDAGGAAAPHGKFKDIVRAESADKRVFYGA